MNELKIMTDYYCYPCWVITESGLYNIAPDSLPISPALAQDLMLWAKTYDDALNRADPAASSFGSHELHMAFVQTGQMLAESVAREIGEGWTVTYFNDLSGELVFVGGTRRV